MPSFSYRATKSDGRVVEGAIEASEERVAVKQLQALDLIPVRVAQTEEAGRELLSITRVFNRVTGQELLSFTRELSSLLRAGVPVERSLTILVNLTESRSFSEVINNIHTDVVSGSTIADAMAKHPGVFSRLYVSMVRSGEASGALDDILVKLAEFLERSRELRSYILSAIIYPALLTFVSGISIIILLMFVLPKFASTFSEVGMPLPLSMAVLLDMSQVLRGYWWLGIALVVASFVGWHYYCRTPQGALMWDRFKLQLPLIGDIIRRVEVARFSRTLGIILKGGVPILSSLSIVREVVGNRVIADEVVGLHHSVKKGEGIGSSLKGSAVIPSLAVEMISVGEETGQLPEILVEIADTFDRQVKERISRLLALLEPGLILIMGLLVGVIVISMLSAIFSMNDISF